MALTATATNTTRASVIRTLNMQKPTVISVPPVKDNIIYAVAEKSSINRAFIPLAEGLREKRTEMGRTLIFCRRYDEMTSIYFFFKQTLGAAITEPPGAPDLAQFRLVDLLPYCDESSQIFLISLASPEYQGYSVLSFVTVLHATQMYMYRMCAKSECLTSLLVHIPSLMLLKAL